MLFSHFERLAADLPHFEAQQKIKLEKGGVDCRVSRRERDLPNTFEPNISSHVVWLPKSPHQTVTSSVSTEPRAENSDPLTVIPHSLDQDKSMLAVSCQKVPKRFLSYLLGDFSKKIFTSLKCLRLIASPGASLVPARELSIKQEASSGYTVVAFDIH